MSADNQKLLDRLEKLRAMAADSSSPHEAAIALDRMQRLMTRHGVNNADLELSQIKEETTELITRNRKKMPEYIATLTVVIGNAFECLQVAN